MTVQYDGSRYKGWQKQGNTDQTIQGKLESVLERMCGYPVEVHGSGRTDAGVHARGQVANFHMKNHPAGNGLESCHDMAAYLNCYLPDDIAVTELKQVEERFHSRLSATEKTYLYRIRRSSIPDVFQRKYTYTMTEPIDVHAMNQAALYLIGEHDFKAFCGNRHFKKSSIRMIYNVQILEVDNELQIRITGNGFLQNMVRILVGTLIEVGLGRRKAEDMESILVSRDRNQAGATMPAQGLILEHVGYNLTICPPLLVTE